MTQKSIHSSLLLVASFVCFGHFNWNFQTKEKKKKRKRKAISKNEMFNKEKEWKKRPTTVNNRVEMPCSFIFIYLLLSSFLFFFSSFSSYSSALPHLFNLWSVAARKQKEEEEEKKKEKRNEMNKWKRRYSIETSNILGSSNTCKSGRCHVSFITERTRRSQQHK
jgi:hypothetical protein